MCHEYCTVNYITLILTIAMVFGVSDFLTERVPVLQRVNYVVMFVVMYVLFTIKYYYGADILHYYNHYVWIGSVSEVWHNPDEYTFEIGYSLLCAWFNSLGISLYGMTAIISTVYFIAVGLLFRQIERYRCFALMLLVVLDYNLIFAAFRQCIAVSFFIFMMLCLQKRKYLLSLLCAVLVVTMHKSGMFVVTLCLLAYLLHNVSVKPIVFQVLMLILGVMLLFPVSRLSVGVLGMLPTSTLNSVAHHLQLGKQVQNVWFVYAMLIVCVEYYMHFQKTRMSTLAIIAIVGIVLLATGYQYYYILNRIRSYFIPGIIVWVFQLVQRAEDAHERIPYAALLKQTCSVIAFAFCIHTTVSFTQTAKKLHAPIYNACTLFDLYHADQNGVREKQLQQARMFWKYDFMKHENNTL